jgi:ribosomal protein S12 methylthiotransferase accessory factor
MPTVSSRLRLDRLLGLWDYLVDPKVGIIQEVNELLIDEDDPNFFHYLSRSCDTARFTSLSNFRNNGGVSVDRYVAIAKALGEAVERYCSAIFTYQELTLAPYRDLTQRATRPDLFALYRPEQFAESDIPWKPFTEDATVSWTKGVSLVTGEEVLVPAALVYVPFHFLRSSADTPIAMPISTGLASGCSFSEAALSGLCEVVERDAFTITWQARLSRPRIDPETLPASARDMLRRYGEVGITVEVMDITTDVRFPAVMTIALSEATASPAVAVAAAADASAEIAVIKSLEELAHTRKFAKQLMEYTPALPVEVEEGHPQVQDQKHHLRFYCPQESKQFIEFAWASSEVRDFNQMAHRACGDPEQELAAMVKELSAAGLEPVACDLTTPDIADLGLRVVRAVVPGMHPLFMGHRNRALGGRRLYEVPQKLGYPGLGPDRADNPYPHPFP